MVYDLNGRTCPEHMGKELRRVRATRSGTYLNDEYNLYGPIKREVPPRSDAASFEL